mmetsp:Transcript_26518/g.79221  ORF Transcript_26518/g.79221 Transcript_26518/m.79221 type:complete len:340 (-) Transcript_26518:35-1054(-)
MLNLPKELAPGSFQGLHPGCRSKGKGETPDLLGKFVLRCLHALHDLLHDGLQAPGGLLLPRPLLLGLQHASQLRNLARAHCSLVVHGLRHLCTALLTPACESCNLLRGPRRGGEEQGAELRRLVRAGRALGRDGGHELLMLLLRGAQHLGDLVRMLGLELDDRGGAGLRQRLQATHQVLSRFKAQLRLICPQGILCTPARSTLAAAPLLHEAGQGGPLLVDCHEALPQSAGLQVLLALLLRQGRAQDLQRLAEAGDAGRTGVAKGSGLDGRRVRRVQSGLRLRARSRGAGVQRHREVVGGAAGQHAALALLAREARAHRSVGVAGGGKSLLWSGWSPRC